MITLSVGQLALLLLGVAVLVAILGGLLHHETGNPKSYGRLAYAIAIIGLVFIGAPAFSGLHLPSRLWRSFETSRAYASETRTQPSVHPQPRRHHASAGQAKKAYSAVERAVLDHLVATTSQHKPVSHKTRL